MKFSHLRIYTLPRIRTYSWLSFSSLAHRIKHAVHLSSEPQMRARDCQESQLPNQVVRPTLSVLIPVFNERLSIEEIIRRVAAVPIDKEIIVVDDCSTDGTTDVLSQFRVEGLRIVYHHHNQGKGTAIRSALKLATGNLAIIQDADLEYDPSDYVRLLHPIVHGQADVVYGVRNLDKQKWLFKSGNRLLTGLTNLLFGSRLHDMETCYKVIPTTLFRALNIQSSRFDLEPEITAKLLKEGHAIYEVPISYNPRVNKKLSAWRDGFPAIVALLRYRL